MQVPMQEPRNDVNVREFWNVRNGHAIFRGTPSPSVRTRGIHGSAAADKTIGCVLRSRNKNTFLETRRVYCSSIRAAGVGCALSAASTFQQTPCTSPRPALAVDFVCARAPAFIDLFSRLHRVTRAHSNDTFYVYLLFLSWADCGGAEFNARARTLRAHTRTL